MKTNKIRGFTLIELMVVVAVVGILASIAYPSYNSAVLKGRRAEGRVALVELMQQQERYMTQRNTYLEFTQATVAVPFKKYSGDSGSGSAAYLLKAEACSVADPIQQCVKLTASPVKSDPEVNSLTFTSTGVKDCTGTAKSTNFKMCWP